jgi:DNA gyrase/topoisomerase IV subunit A
MCAKIKTKDITPIGRVTTGRKAIKVGEFDEVLLGIPISEVKKDKYLVIGTEKGFIVKTDINEYTCGNLNRTGQKALKLAATDTVINGMICDNNDNILIISTNYSKAVNVSEFAQTTRDSAGRVAVKNGELIKNLVKI